MHCEFHFPKTNNNKNKNWKNFTFFLYFFWFVEEFMDDCVCVCVWLVFGWFWMEFLICFVGALHWWTELMTHNTNELTMIFIYCNIFFLFFVHLVPATHTQFTSHFSLHLYSHSLSGVTDFRFWRLKSIFICNLQQNEKHFFFSSSPGSVIAYISIHATIQTVFESYTIRSFGVRVCVYEYVYV